MQDGQSTVRNSAASVDRNLAYLIERCVLKVVNDWYKARRRQERSGQPRREKKPARNRQELKEAVFVCMLQGLQKASGNGRVDQVSARTLYYNVRELIQSVTDRELSWSNFNTLLRDYQRDNGKIENLTRDPRGWVIEPHTQRIIPLGTREVGQYKIPPFLYDKVLFVEKKGLHPILKAAKLAERFDMAIMCSEGFAPDAAKALLAAAEKQRMTLFCLHDADPAGYLIAHVLRNGTAANPDKVKIIDIGLTLGEAMQMGLQGETFTRKKNLPAKLVLNELEQCHFGGTEVEVNGKPVWKDCKRVELNALAADPDRFISFIERKLRLHKAHGKLVPPKTVIKRYAAQTRASSLERAIDEMIRAELDIQAMTVELVKVYKPDVAIEGLPKKVRSWARGRRPEPWTACVEGAVNDRVEALWKQLLAAVRARIAR